jgi:hypothetical protein
LGEEPLKKEGEQSQIDPNLAYLTRKNETCWISHIHFPFVKDKHLPTIHIYFLRYFWFMFLKLSYNYRSIPLNLYTHSKMCRNYLYFINIEAWFTIYTSWISA